MDELKKLMKNALRILKKRQLKFLKTELKKNKNEDVKGYLDACIDVLDHELENKALIIVDRDKQIEELLLSIDFTENEAYMLSILFANKVVSNSQMLHTHIERGKSYRILNKLQDLNLISKTNTSIVEYFVLNRDEPLKYIIEDLVNKLSNLRNVSKKIRELLV